MSSDKRFYQFLKEWLEQLLKAVPAKAVQKTRGEHKQGGALMDLVGLAAFVHLESCDSKQKYLNTRVQNLTDREQFLVCAFYVILRVCLETNGSDSECAQEILKNGQDLEECVGLLLEKMQEFPAGNESLQDGLSMIFATPGVVPYLATHKWFFDGVLSDVLLDAAPDTIFLSATDAKELLTVILADPDPVQKVAWFHDILLQSNHWNHTKVKMYLRASGTFYEAYQQRLFWDLFRRFEGLESGPDRAGKKKKKKFRAELNKLAKEDFNLMIPFDGLPRIFLEFFVRVSNFAPQLPKDARMKIVSALQTSRFAGVINLYPWASSEGDLHSTLVSESSTLGMDTKTNQLFKAVATQVADEEKGAYQRDLEKILTLAGADKPFLPSDDMARVFVSEVMKKVVSMLVERLETCEDDVRRLLGSLLFFPWSKELLRDGKEYAALLKIMTLVRFGGWLEHKQLFKLCTERLWEVERGAGRDPLMSLCNFVNFRGGLSFLLRHRELYTPHVVSDCQELNIWAYILLKHSKHSRPGLRVRPGEISECAEVIAADSNLQSNLIPVILSMNPEWTPDVARRVLGKKLPYVWLLYLLWRVEFNFSSQGDSAELFRDLENLQPIIREQEWKVEPTRLENLLSGFKVHLIPLGDTEAQKYRSLKDTLRTLANWSAFEKQHHACVWFPPFFWATQRSSQRKKSPTSSPQSKRSKQVKEKKKPPPSVLSPASRDGAAACSSSPTESPPASQTLGKSSCSSSGLDSSATPQRKQLREEEQEHVCSWDGCGGKVMRQQRSFCRKEKGVVWLCPSHWDRAVEGKTQRAKQCPLCLPVEHTLTHGECVKNSGKEVTVKFRMPKERQNHFFSGRRALPATASSTLRPSSPFSEENDESPAEERAVQQPRTVSTPPQPEKKNKGRSKGSAAQKRTYEGPAEEFVYQMMQGAESTIDWSRTLASEKVKKQEHKKGSAQRKKKSAPSDLDVALHQALSFRPSRTSPSTPKKRPVVPTAYSKPHEDSTLLFTENECVVCLDAEPTTRLLPCQHRALCSKCSPMCEVCPICRGNISERVQE